MRSYLGTPGLNLRRLVNLPGYSPDFNADEPVWGWVREEATGNPCLGSKALVQQRAGNLPSGLASRSGEVKRRCRNSPAIKGRSTPARLAARFGAHPKCTSHFGFGFGLGVMPP